MKPILVLLGVGIVGAGLYFFVTYGSTTEVENPTVEEVEQVEVIEEVDVLDEAQQALDKANALLDVEEERLLKEREEIDLRLEEIIKKRTSF